MEKTEDSGYPSYEKPDPEIMVRTVGLLRSEVILFVLCRYEKPVVQLKFFTLRFTVERVNCRPEDWSSATFPFFCATPPRDWV